MPPKKEFHLTRAQRNVDALLLLICIGIFGTLIFSAQAKYQAHRAAASTNSVQSIAAGDSAHANDLAASK